LILPIIAYGNPVLRKVASEITPDYPGLEKLIADMWETMYGSNGVGLAAPQVNKSIRLFIADTLQMYANMDEQDKAEFAGDEGVKEVFVNAHIIALEGERWSYNEGCLSIPKIREDVSRQETVTLKYLNEDFQPITRSFSGLSARVILHEYDHIEGRLFIDHISALKRKLMKGRLNDISKGKVSVDYKMLFPG
jgi:peptide deformylase